MPTWLTAILATVGGAIATAFQKVVEFLVAVEVGRLRSENNKLAEETKRIEEANAARDAADSDDTPDPYLRD